MEEKVLSSQVSGTPYYAGRAAKPQVLSTAHVLPESASRIGIQTKQEQA